MADWTKRNLKTHFNRAVANGWLATFVSAAQANNFPVEILLAIASRETNMENKRGDYRGGRYHGYGLMQLDIGSHAEWINTGAWKDPHKVIEKGAKALWQKRREVANLAKAAGKKLSEQDLLRTSVAAYNHGSTGSYADLIKYDNPDRNTTGKDYSADVLNRADVFREFLLLRTADAVREFGEAASKATEQMSRVKTEDPSILFKIPSDNKVSPESEITLATNPSASPLDSAGGSGQAAGGPSSGEKPGEPVSDVPAKADEAVIGGRPGDEPKQATQGSKKSLWATILGGLMGAGTAIKGALSGHDALMVAGVVCATLLLLALIFRQLIIDWARLHLNADPSKYNVR